MMDNHVSMTDGDTHPMSPNANLEDLYSDEEAVEDLMEENMVECEICDGKGVTPCYSTEDITDVDFDDCIACGGCGKRLEEDDEEYEGDY